MLSEMDNAKRAERDIVAANLRKMRAEQAMARLHDEIRQMTGQPKFAVTAASEGDVMHGETTL